MYKNDNLIKFTLMRWHLLSSSARRLVEIIRAGKQGLRGLIQRRGASLGCLRSCRFLVKWHQHPDSRLGKEEIQRGKEEIYTFCNFPYSVVLHGSLLESRRGPVGDGVHGGETAEPVTDGIGVAGPDQYPDAGLHDG